MKGIFSAYLEHSDLSTVRIEARKNVQKIQYSQTGITLSKLSEKNLGQKIP